ncbi:hypothetical protein E3U55_02335 [Filobacillus milosensis]|uniref:PDZ domain-containing protein n=1 Tax=Filobacillus milosensis TaxID=94137 RepID=A0A4Y8ITI5_9BACI|nr:hypothetical protein [Filobacillus milosensis]TFB24359.1 hypothetical protein E3U55_02335 [Filobacillus milosensis]
MDLEWLKEFGLGLLWVFAQPLLYIAIAFTFWTGYYRVKNDRKMFGHRVFPIGAEWHGTMWLGIMFGVILSTSLILSGSLLNYQWLLLISTIVFVFALSNQIWLLSPIYTIGLALIGVWLFGKFSAEPNAWFSPLLEVDLVLISFLLTSLVIAEVILIRLTKRNKTFPEMKKGDRGKYIGGHHVKRLMMVPFFVPVPNGVLELSMFNWWPMFSISDTFGLMLFPFIIGYSQRFGGSFSEIGAKRTSNALAILALVLVGGSVAVYFYPEWTIALGIIAIAGRALIHGVTHYLDLEKRSIFTPKQDGIIVVGIIPGSPADEMGIHIGEKIEKIHDIEVTNEHEFYEVMSDHRTFCKLAVRDFNGEIRFVQRALYEGEYHELGLIFVKETPRFTLKTEEIS